VYASKGPVVEEWADRRFFRPAGWRIATWLMPTRISPDAVTFASLVLGILAGHLFWYRSAWINAGGVLLFIQFLCIIDLQMNRRIKVLQHVIARHQMNLRQPQKVKSPNWPFVDRVVQTVSPPPVCFKHKPCGERCLPEFLTSRQLMVI